MQVEDLDVFKLSHELTQQIYGLTKDFPENEKYGLMSQMRRAAYSVPMNLMEGDIGSGKMSLMNTLVRMLRPRNLMSVWICLMMVGSA